MKTSMKFSVTKSWFLLLICYVLVSCVHTKECLASNSSSIRLLVQSQRNSTGHRNMKVQLQSRAGAVGAADLAAVEAEQAVTMCDGVHVLYTTAVVTAPPAVFRLPGFELFPGMGYYKFYPRAVTWDEALHSCMADGAVLLAPSSEAEVGVLKHLMARKATVEGATWPHWVYAGFHDKGVEGQYFTVEGKRLNESGYVKWHPGQPDNTAWGTEGDQDCGGINNAGLMQDLPCLAKIPFICKQSL